MYEDKAVKHREAQIVVGMHSFGGKESAKGLLGRQSALEGEVWVSKRMHCVKDIFMTWQVALDFRVPDSQLYASEEQECTIGQYYVVGGPGQV